MKLHLVLFCIIISFIATTNGLCQKDTCVILTGVPLNPDSYYTVKKILENQLDCYVNEVSLETDEIVTADLRNVKFLYWAGGPYFLQQDPMTRKNIRLVSYGILAMLRLHPKGLLRLIHTQIRVHTRLPLPLLMEKM